MVDFIPQCDPSALVASLRGKLSDAIFRVLDKGPYILGQEVEAFEDEWANWCGAEFAVGCANGTDALELIIRSLDLPENSLILAPSHTAVATIAAIVRAGHRPMLADVDSATYCLSSDSVSRCIEEGIRLGDRLRAVIAVHLYGHPADVSCLQELCRVHEIPLMEDGSQAHGAEWHGRRVGSFGVAAGFSLYPTKNLGALGDAGVITCGSGKQAARLKRLRQYGWEQPAISQESGVNSRLDPLQAAILRVKLPLLESHNYHRQAIAALYRERLAGHDALNLPPAADGIAKPVYHQFVIQLSPAHRDSIRKRLVELGVGTLLHYPMAAHQMPAYRNLPLDPAGLSTTEKLLPRILSLPMGPHLSLEQAAQVAERLLQAIKEID